MLPEEINVISGVALERALRKKKALEDQVDAAIAQTQKLLHQRHDRRGPIKDHDPENRSGFDRRAKVSPMKE